MAGHGRKEGGAGERGAGERASGRERRTDPASIPDVFDAEAASGTASAPGSPARATRRAWSRVDADAFESLHFALCIAVEL